MASYHPHHHHHPNPNPHHDYHPNPYPHHPHSNPHHDHHPNPYHPISTPTTTATTTTTTACYCCYSYTNHPPCHHPPPLPPNAPHFHTTPQHHQPDHHQNQHLQPILSSLLLRISALETTLTSHTSHTSQSLRDYAARVIQTHFRAFLLHRSTTLRHLKHLASIKSTLNALKATLSKNSYTHYNALYAQATNLLLALDSIQGGDPMIRDGKMSVGRELNQFLKLIDGGFLKKSELSTKIVKNMRCGGNNSKPRVVYSDKRGGNVEIVKVGRRGDGTFKGREQIKRIGELDMVDESEDEEYEELDRLHTLLGRKKGVSVSRSGGIKLQNGSQTQVKRNVRFADNENAYKVMQSRKEPVLIGDCDIADSDDDADDDDDDDGNLGDADQYLIIDNHRREAQENGILSQQDEDDEEEEDEDSPPSSNGGSDVTFSSRIKNEGRRASYDQCEDGTFTFSAPLPVLMEPRADSVSRKKLVK